MIHTATVHRMTDDMLGTPGVAERVAGHLSAPGRVAAGTDHGLAIGARGRG